MLKRILIFIIILLLSINVEAQSWYKQVARNEIAISFPFKPEYSFYEDKGIECYKCKTDHCKFALTFMDATKVIEDFEHYKSSSDSEQVKIAISALEGIAYGKIRNRNQHLISMKGVLIQGKYVGLDIEYATHEPSNPESKKKFSSLFIIRNNFYLVDCWYLDNQDHKEEKDKFFNSLLINE